MRLVTNLTSTVDVTDNERISGWVSDQLLKVLRTHVTTQIIRNGWPILGLMAYSAEIEQATIEAANGQLAAYGIGLTRMGNFDINLSPEDEQQLKQLAKDTSYSQLAGGFGNYAQGEMALGAGQGMAKGGAGTEGAFLGAGFGLASGLGRCSRRRPSRPRCRPPSTRRRRRARRGRAGMRELPGGQPGGCAVLHGLRPAARARGRALHRMRGRASRRRTFLRGLRDQGRRLSGPRGVSSGGPAAWVLRGTRPGSPSQPWFGPEGDALVPPSSVASLLPASGQLVPGRKRANRERGVSRL